MALAGSTGFTGTYASKNTGSALDSEVVSLLNMVYERDTLSTRRGIDKVKNNTQWGNSKVIRQKAFRDSANSYYYHLAALDNGKLYYITSTDANYNTVGATWTEITDVSGVSPAFSTTPTRVVFEGFNNKLYVLSETNTFWYINFSTNRLVAVTSPTGLSGSEVFRRFAVYEQSLWAFTDTYAYKSAVLDGTDFTTTADGAGRIGIGRVDGVTIIGANTFEGGVLISASDNVTKKFQAQLLVGDKFYDPATAGTEVNSFEIKPLNTFNGAVGDSVQEIGSDLIMLTTKGFTTLSAVAASGVNFGLTKSNIISSKIPRWIKEINFSKADQIFSLVDYDNSRYWCAVPYGAGVQNATMVLAYDFENSTQDNQKWMRFEFAFSSIGSMEIIAGVPYVADRKGNIFKCEVEDVYDDDGSAYLAEVVTKSFGGLEVFSEKMFTDDWLVMTNVATDPQDFTIWPVLDDIIYGKRADGEEFRDVTLEPARRYPNYDETGVIYDSDYTYDDSRITKVVIHLKDRGGSAYSKGLRIRTNAVGAKWSLTAVATQFDDEAETRGT